jgi:hypothetical protein
MRALPPIAALLLGCAATSPPAPAPPPPPFAERRAADLTWQPGDSQPASREIVRLTPPPPPDATVLPMTLATEIRNRCAEPAIFTVGPPDATPDDASPTNRLAAGEAIVTGITTDEHLFLRTATGWTRVDPDGHWIVFTGETTCDAATSIR